MGISITIRYCKGVPVSRCSTSRYYCDRLARYRGSFRHRCSLSSIVESRFAERGARGENYCRSGSDELSLAIVSRSGHNFTGDSRSAVYSLWITKRGVGRGEGEGEGTETGREFVLLPLSLACRTSYLPDWKPPALLIPNKSVWRQPGTARPLHRARS